MMPSANKKGTCGGVGKSISALRSQRVARRWTALILTDVAGWSLKKVRREVQGAERGYRDLNRQALRLLAPHGQLVTCTCSHHVTPPRFEELLRQAAAGLPFRIALRQRLGAGEDHPALVTHPESEYLKVLRAQRMEDA